jgi:hypothetical protein
MGFGKFAEHIGTVLTPSDLFGVENGDLPEQSIYVGLVVDQIHVHKLVSIGELRGEVTLEETLDLGLSLARDLLQVLEDANKGWKTLGSQEA